MYNLFPIPNTRLASNCCHSSYSGLPPKGRRTKIMQQWCEIINCIRRTRSIPCRKCASTWNEHKKAAIIPSAQGNKAWRKWWRKTVYDFNNKFVSPQNHNNNTNHTHTYGTAGVRQNSLWLPKKNSWKTPFIGLGPSATMWRRKRVCVCVRFGRQASKSLMRKYFL